MQKTQFLFSPLLMVGLILANFILITLKFQSEYLGKDWNLVVYHKSLLKTFLVLRHTVDTRRLSVLWKLIRGSRRFILVELSYKWEEIYISNRLSFFIIHINFILYTFFIHSKPNIAFHWGRRLGFRLNSCATREVIQRLRKPSEEIMCTN